MAREFDLFGNPMPRNFGERGRPEHVPTAENENKIRLLLVANWTKQQIAEELGITAKTLNKHYFHIFDRARKIAIRELKGKVLLQLDQAAEAGNVSAMKELRKIAEQEELALLPPEMKPGKTVKRAPEKLGKKDRLKQEARSPSGGWDEILPGAEIKH